MLIALTNNKKYSTTVNMRKIPNEHIICDKLFEVYICAFCTSLIKKNCEQYKFNNNYAIIISVVYMVDRLNNVNLFVPELRVCAPLLSPGQTKQR